MRGFQARQIAEQISAGEGRAIRMSRADELIYQRAWEEVAPLGLALDTAAIELAQARTSQGLVFCGACWGWQDSEHPAE